VKNRHIDPDAFEVIKRKTFDAESHAAHALRQVGGSSTGPDPRPDWLITSPDATDTELGILKTGKEAVVSLVERRCGEQSQLLARKTYRDVAQRSFRQDATYRDGRNLGRGRQRLLNTGGHRGTQLRAAEWRQREFLVLCDLWSVGVAVPYPVDMAGESILMQYLGDQDGAGPRLMALRPSVDQLADLWQQAVGALQQMTDAGYVHGDLSPYNVLVWEDRLWVIDLPQALTISQTLMWQSLLERDVANLARWFGARGLEVDTGEVLADLIGGRY